MSGSRKARGRNDAPRGSKKRMAMKTKALEPGRRLSLFEIEARWIPLIEDRIAAETDPQLSDERPVCLTCGGGGDISRTAPGEVSEPCEACEGTGRSKSSRERAIEAADVALVEHSTAEVERADSYIGLIRYLEAAIALRRAEAQRNTLAARIAERILEQVKATAVFVMTEAKRPRIEGSSGSYLLAKKSGGMAPLLITDPALVPDDLCRLEGWVNAGVWGRMVAIVRRHVTGEEWEPTARWTGRVPDNAAIRAQLDLPCPKCNGDGAIRATEKIEGERSEVVCSECGGSKTAGVPGARIGERGTHLEVK
jgi:hypothetical protein